MQSVSTLPQIHPVRKDPVRELLGDLEHEFIREMHHDTTQSDRLVRKHVMGLVTILFSLVCAILLASMVAVRLFYHPALIR